MEIERLLDISKSEKDQKEVLIMIISNRITHYLGDESGAAVGSKNFNLLCADLLKWHEANK